jgi:hypothetical protein
MHVGGQFGDESKDPLSAVTEWMLFPLPYVHVIVVPALTVTVVGL